MIQLAAGALTFLRPDVSPAKETLARSYSRMQVIEGLRMSRGEAPFFTPGFPPGLALVHSLRIGNLDGEATAQPAAPAGDPIQSDTAEIAWHAPAEGGGVVTVDAPRGQALIGHLRANARQTSHLAAAPANPFVAVTLNTLDGKPVAESSRMLLTTGAKVANEGMVWNEERNRVVKPGGPPVLIETVVGSVTLRQLRGARDVLAQPLTSGGKSAGEPVRARRVGVDWRIGLEPETAAPWYLVRVER
jgi:hypothetical protein